MRRWTLISMFLLLLGCNGENTKTYLTTEKAIFYFKSIEDICNRENGKLWGHNLYGPLMFIDRASREIVANHPDQEGLLKEKNGIYTGSFPRERIINNAPVLFGGTEFAMAPLPNEEDDYKILTRAFRSLFHLYQIGEGITVPSYNTNNMDEKEARLWIKLEWKALEKAIKAEGNERDIAIRDALIFRGANRELYRKYSIDENKFETYEGLATFTSTLLCTDSSDEFKIRLFENLNRIYSMSSYARSYGYIHGALYAYLLYINDFDFREIDSVNFDLGKKVQEIYSIELPSICRDVAGSLAVNYEIETINKEEENRLSDIKERIHRQTSTFTDKPVIFFELESPYFDFEPEEMHPLDTLGTLYDALRISDNWGKLTVDKGGCLVSNNFKFLRITAKGFKEEKNHFTGEGWNLFLNSNWELIEVDQNYFVRKLMP